jgi:hypothetical protein
VEDEMKKIPDHFTVDGYEVRFLQSAPVTVCVIRSLTDLAARYTGIAVCNPHDKWDEATGRHKAMKSAIESGHRQSNPSTPLCGSIIITCTFSYGNKLPVKAIQKAYWEHYKDIE